MKKVLLVTMLCVVLCQTAFSQTEETQRAAFQLSLFTPLSTNGLHSALFTNKVSLNLLMGASKNETICTLGGLSNVIINDAKGVQLAGLSNYIGKDAHGFQIAGLININRGSFNGLQVAGLVNIAKEVRGVQFAGLINIAKNSDVPIGLINIIKNGEMGVAITYDGIGNAVASFRSGGKYTYGILGVGYNHKMKDKGLVAEAALGAHIPVTKWFRINNEIKASTIGCNSNDPVLNAGYSLLPAFRLGRHIELFGGVGINYMETKNMNAGSVFANQSWWKGDNSTKWQQVYIGYQVGVQYIF